MEFFETDKKTFEAIMKSHREGEQSRADEMPTEIEALEVLFRAYQRLKELGWKEVIYCSKDRHLVEVIEMGSTGIHDAQRDEHGRFWVLASNDLWPSRPILYREKTQ